MSDVGRYDAVVAGGGMVGCAVAALLARAGFRVALVESSPPNPFDARADYGLRVSALSPGSAAILAEAGAWRAIEANRHCPYRRMRIEDRDRGTLLEMEAPVHGLERLGTIVENDLVRTALWDVLQGHALVDVVCPQRLAGLEQRGSGVRVNLESGSTLGADLLVGADGPVSRVRSLAGLDRDIWTYNQSGLVCVVRTERLNPAIAWQRFLGDGPLAFLPLDDGRSSIVWTLPSAAAQHQVQAGEKEFLEGLTQACGAWLGEVLECGPRAAFPLDMGLGRHYVSGRVALLGDAAHRVHPLAGQGVNLGLADAAALVETLVAHRLRGTGAAEDSALRRFERWRKSESAVMALGIHALGGLFRPDALTPLRRIGLKAVERSWFLKEPFIRRAAGIGRNAPALARGITLAELARPGRPR